MKNCILVDSIKSLVIKTDWSGILCLSVMILVVLRFMILKRSAYSVLSNRIGVGAVPIRCRYTQWLEFVVPHACINFVLSFDSVPASGVSH